jgi:hypothetical protein
MATSSSAVGSSVSADVVGAAVVVLVVVAVVLVDVSEGALPLSSPQPAASSAVTRRTAPVRGLLAVLMADIVLALEAVGPDESIRQP